jgi:hypothetical protein
MNFNRNFILLLMMVILSCGATISFAFPPAPVSAQCRITCRVAEVVEWSNSTFGDIDLGELNSRHLQSQGQSALVLYTNGDVILTADNSQNAQMRNGSYALNTKYQLKFDGSGVEQTGGRPTEWCTYDTFLKEASEILHSQSDGAVEIILSVKAEVENIRPGSGGEYCAVQTITACWKS